MNKTTYDRAAAEFEARATAKPKSINLDDLQWEAEALVSLLKDRERGLISWNVALKDKLKNIHEIIKPVFE